MPDRPAELDALLGLSRREARERLAASGLVPLWVEAAPPRPRRPFPPADDWRVARVRRTETQLELVVVPTIVLDLQAPIP